MYVSRYTFAGLLGVVNSHHLYGTRFQRVPNGPHASPRQRIATNHRRQKTIQEGAGGGSSLVQTEHRRGHRD